MRTRSSKMYPIHRCFPSSIWSQLIADLIYCWSANENKFPDLKKEITHVLDIISFFFNHNNTNLLTNTVPLNWPQIERCFFRILSHFSPHFRRLSKNRRKKNRWWWKNAFYVLLIHSLIFQNTVCKK